MSIYDNIIPGDIMANKFDYHDAYGIRRVLWK